MPRMMLILGLAVAAAFGAGAMFLYNYLAPNPAPVIRPAWQVVPMSPQVPVAACREGFARAFRAAGFNNIAPGVPESMHVQAADNGYSAVGICMPRREAAAILVTGIDAAVVDARLDAISAAIMGRAPAPGGRTR